MTPSVDRQLRGHAKSAAEAVTVAASHVGVDLFESQAKAVAGAALGYADSTAEIGERFPRYPRENEGFRDHVRRELRLKLLDAVISNNTVPVALPTETITYRKWSYAPGQTDSEVPESADWDRVEIRLSVRTRKVEPDREHAAAGVTV